MENAMSFREWIMGYEGQSNCFGRLARIITQAVDLPIYGTLNTYYAYLSKGKAPKDVLETLVFAWKFYADSSLRSKPLDLSFWGWLQKASKSGRYEALWEYIKKQSLDDEVTSFYPFYSYIRFNAKSVDGYFKNTRMAVTALREAWQSYDRSTVLLGDKDYGVGDCVVADLPPLIQEEGWFGERKNAQVVVNRIYPWGAALVINGCEVNASFRVCRALKVITDNNNDEWLDVQKYLVATGVC